MRLADVNVKCLGLRQFTVRQVVFKWRHFNTVATLCRGGHPAKVTPKAQHVAL